MANEVIMLSKTYKNHKSLILPATVTEKLDGAPGDFHHGGFKVMARTRQNEPILSCDHIKEFLEDDLLPKGHHVIGELYIEGMDFKDISGLVRRKETSDETRKLVLHIFDYVIDGQPDMTYKERMQAMDKYVGGYLKKDDPVRIVPGTYIDSPEKFDAFMKKFQKDKPNAEGVVIRALEGDKSVYKEGWRSPGMVKLKVTETIDLPIAGFEEARSKDGEPLGMVGRIHVWYPAGVDVVGDNHYADHKAIGVGPGKLTHAQRKEIFANQKEYLGKIIEIAYMPDDSYEALREARFHRFRPDKD